MAPGAPALRGSGRYVGQLSAYPEDFRAAAIGSVVVFGRLVTKSGDDEVSRKVIWTWRLRDGLIVSLRVNVLG